MITLRLNNAVYLRTQPYYTGSTKNLERRLREHQNGEGANFTKKHGPVELIYFEEYERIDFAFNREKQVQGWSRKKKEALINGECEQLPKLAKKNWFNYKDRQVKQDKNTE
ncbi:MAG: GIY-YIG nuclease family protein [Melioribacteraceae bacterium]|nr:GIY-YIG nuclease family protein [Melioribacteraceae bacterium]